MQQLNGIKFNFLQIKWSIIYLNTRPPSLPVGGRRINDVGIAVEELADALAGNGHHLQVLKRYEEKDVFESSV